MKNTYHIDRAPGLFEFAAAHRTLAYEDVPHEMAIQSDLVLRDDHVEIDCFWRWMNFAAWVAVR